MPIQKTYTPVEEPAVVEEPKSPYIQGKRR